MKRKFGALVIDMQEVFVSRIEPNQLVAMIEAQQEVLSYFNDLKLPIIFSEFVSFGNIIPELMQGHRINHMCKESNDFFDETKLRRMLSEEQVTDLVLMGINASYCVKATAATALERGYMIHSSRDLIADGTGIDYSKTENSHLWYACNGTYEENYSDLLDVVKGVRKMPDFLESRLAAKHFST